MTRSASSLPERTPTAFEGCNSALIGVGIFSAVINILALTGSIYMLQVYDRVVPSRSIETLIGLTIILVGLYLSFGILDIIRGRVLSRIGLRIDKNLRDQTFSALAKLPLSLGRQSALIQPTRDLDSVRMFFSGLGPTALFDFPWIPFYLALIFYLHLWLGILASIGAIILISFAVITEFSSRKAVQNAEAGVKRDNFVEEVQGNSEVIRAMGMERPLGRIWGLLNKDYLSNNLKSSDVTGGLGSAAKVFRMLLQSFVLGLGAYLVTIDQASAGVMIAASIMTSRALAPIEIAISHWKAFVAARAGLKRLKRAFTLLAEQQKEIDLPEPQNSLKLKNVSVVAPGTRIPILGGIAFEAKAGDGIGIVGPSGSGKSTLVRALVGVWPTVLPGGTVRLDDADLDQWSPERRGNFIGYVPQNVELFGGSIAQNICRFQQGAETDDIIKAAKTAGVHEFILGLDQGYDTQIGGKGQILSGGQQQRIALARALYKEPFLVVLDEPNSNLDESGDIALGEAIKSVRDRNGIVIVVSHRPSALDELNLVLALEKGAVKGFGKKQENAPQDEAIRMPGTAVKSSRNSKPEPLKTSPRIAIVEQKRSKTTKK